jgi:hypothetical protein
MSHEWVILILDPLVLTDSVGLNFAGCERRLGIPTLITTGVEVNFLQFFLWVARHLEWNRAELRAAGNW